MMLKKIDLDEYLFGVGKEAETDAEQRKILAQMRKDRFYTGTG